MTDLLFTDSEVEKMARNRADRLLNKYEGVDPSKIKAAVRMADQMVRYNSSSSRKRAVQYMMNKPEIQKADVAKASVGAAGLATHRIERADTENRTTFDDRVLSVWFYSSGYHRAIVTHWTHHAVVRAFQRALHLGIKDDEAARCFINSCAAWWTVNIPDELAYALVPGSAGDNGGSVCVIGDVCMAMGDDHQELDKAVWTVLEGDMLTPEEMGYAHVFGDGELMVTSAPDKYRMNRDVRRTFEQQRKLLGGVI